MALTITLDEVSTVGKASRQLSTCNRVRPAIGGSGVTDMLLCDAKFGSAPFLGLHDDLHIVP